MSGACEAVYQASVLRPVSFWAEAAEGIEWTRRWDEVLDRHVLAGRGEATAVICAPVVERLPKTHSGTILRSAVRKTADGVDLAVPETIEDASVIEDLWVALGDDQSGAVSLGGAVKPHRATTTHNPSTKESEHGI